jgi:hypothetical protein
MLNRFLCLLAAIPVAGCVTESRRETITFQAPPVASATDAAEASADPLGLEAAIAVVTQRPWCPPRR